MTKEQVSLYEEESIVLDSESNISLSWDKAWALWVNGSFTGSYKNNTNTWEKQYSLFTLTDDRKVSIWCTINGLDVPSYDTSYSNDADVININTDRNLVRVMSNTFSLQKI